MPHCLIEYAKTLTTEVSPEQLIESVYLGTLNSGLFSGDDIKTRIIPFDHFTSGTIKQNFIHVTLKILNGRSIEQQKGLSQAVLDELNRLPLTDISLTVEVVEIQKACYSKTVK
ncbi:MAG: 5-carboxymethyl-2-hydroxymuconate Delta-isomerase [Colwellia sp.]|nr:5-carboxymethyl-2-hydroxymuconate Delta-isomerase [Colwellia sp.]